MKLFSYLSVAVLLLSSLALAAYSPDLLSALIVGLMCIIALAGCIHGLLPTISITSGLLNGKKTRASSYLSHSVAGRTSFSGSAVRAAGTMANIASFIMLKVNLTLCAEHGIPERDVQVIAKTGTFSRAASSSGR